MIGRQQLHSTGSGLVVTSPRAITAAVTTDHLVRVVSERSSGGLTALVTVLTNNVDSLRDDSVGSAGHSLVVEDDSVGGSLEVSVQVETVLCAVTVGIVRVVVPVNDNKTPPVVEVLNLVRSNVAIRSTEASRHNTEDLPKSIFNQLNLSVKLLVVELADVRVTPRVRADLVTTLVCVPQPSDRVIVVDAAVVVAVDEEGTFLSTSVAESVDKLCHGDVRAIVEGHGQTPACGAAFLDAVDLSSLFELVTGAVGAIVEGVAVGRHMCKLLTDVFRDGVGNSAHHRG